MDYIISSNTLFLFYDGKNTIINELSTELVYENNIIKKLLDLSCQYYGSSLKGRVIGSKNLINSRYKVPIIVSDKNKILFFQVASYKNNEIIWFNFNAITDYKKEDNCVKVFFVSGLAKKFMISYAIFNNQILKCSRLWLVYLSRG